MAKSSIQNITTTQTFQNWFDKTNEMVDLFRNQTVTATALGDVTIGDAFIQGDFTANNLFADTEFRSDVIGSFTNGGAVSFSSPITVTNPAAQQVATFTYPDGAQTRYTDGTLSWDIGFDTSEDANFIIDTGTGDPKFKVSSAGSINSFNMFLSEGLTANTITATTITGDISANTITATTITSSTFIGNLTGDVYAPGGTTKVFENGNGAGIPATFTGNVNGTVSSLTNHTTNNLTEGSNRLYFTTARARASFSAGTGVNISDGAIAIGQDVAITSSPTFADITAEDGNFSGTVDADKFTGDGSELTGIVQLLKGFITFNGSTGAVIASSGLTLSKSGTGNYAINISAGIRPPNSAYGVVIGNVDDGRTSVNAQRAPDSQTTNYNAFVSTRSSTSFTIRASKNYSTYVGIPSDDNIGQTVLGIQAVDPTLITALLVY
tara:strand:- start:3566 stop:4876 length:1311 start_codon:yes stop_codon:yes gene_type:complete